jgi:hypothetical protein
MTPSDGGHITKSDMFLLMPLPPKHRGIFAGGSSRGRRLRLMVPSHQAGSGICRRAGWHWRDRLARYADFERL